MRRHRSVLVASLLCTVWWACTEASPTGSTRAVEIGIVPNFQIDPALFATAPIDRIRLTARNSSNSQLVGSTNVSVSPTATEWRLPLGIDLGGAATMQVVVEAELLSGTVVVWSGRLGPFTVPSGAPARTLDVYPGPLANQDVLTVGITGAPAQLAVGASAQLGANFTLIPGSSASPVVLWASTAPSVATVTPQGSSVTVTGVSLGTADIFATAGTAYAEFTLQVVAPAQYTKVWVGGDAGGATNWDNPANWSPAGVPGSNDEVLVDVTANQPVFATSRALRSITLGNTSSVNMSTFTLTVSGNVNAGPGGLQNGTVLITGTGSVLQGNFDNLQVGSNRALSGQTVTQGTLTVTRNLDVNGQVLTVTDSLWVTGPNARLLMTSAGSVVNSNGETVFDGADHSGALTTGTMVLGGYDFVVTTRSATGFPPSPSHVVRFDGNSPAQSVVFGLPVSGQQSFGSVVISNPTGVSFDSNVFTTGNVDVLDDGRLVIPVGTTTAIGGSLTLLNGAELVVDGTLTALGGCVNVGATISGRGTHPCGGGPAGDRTWIGGVGPDPLAWNQASNWTPSGVPGFGDDVVIQNANWNPRLDSDVTVASLTLATPNGVDLANFTMAVLGDVDAGGNGLNNGMVHIAAPGSILQGTFSNLRVGVARTLTDLTYVFGDLQVDDVLDTNGRTLSISGDLLVEGPTARLVQTNPGAIVVTAGNATFSGADHTGALTDGFFSVGGDFFVTDASPTAFVSSGSHLVSFNGGGAQTVAFDVPGASQQRLNLVTLSGLGGVTFATDAYVTGDLSLNGHMIVPFGATTTVDGTLTRYTSSTLEVYGTLVVGVACVDEGGIILGTGTQPCGTPAAADRVWLGGDAGGAQDWSNPNNWSPVGVPTAAETVLIPVRSNPPLMSTNASVAALTVQGGTFVDLGSNSVTVSGDLKVDGVIVNGLVQVTGAGTLLEGNFQDLLIGAPRSLSGIVTTIGDLNIEDRLTVGPNVLSVSGALRVETISGELVLDDQSATVYALGDALFAGASLAGDLTAGTLALNADFTAANTFSTSSFQSTGTLVYFTGSTDQIISFSNPGTGPAQQSFADMYMVGGGASLIFETDAYVTGLLFAESQVLRQGGAATLYASGTLALTTVTFDGLPLRLVTNQTSGSHTLDSITFTGMAPTAVQLYLDLPPVVGASVVPLVLDSPVFATVPSGGGYYIEATNPIATQLVIQLNSPTPTADGGFTKVSGNTVINWGP